MSDGFWKIASAFSYSVAPNFTVTSITMNSIVKRQHKNHELFETKSFHTKFVCNIFRLFLTCVTPKRTAIFLKKWNHLRCGKARVCVEVATVSA